jgi:hypothetical protein
MIFALRPYLPWRNSMPRYASPDERRRRAEEQRRRKLNADVQRRANEEDLRRRCNYGSPMEPPPAAPAAAFVPKPREPQRPITDTIAMTLPPPAAAATPAAPTVPPPPTPTVVAVNPTPQPADVSPIPPPAIVEDASKLAIDVEQIAQAAIDQIKEILRHPLDRQDPNFAALLRFLSSTYNTSMTTILRANENQLRRQEISRVPEYAARADEEERKLAERRLAARAIEGTLDDDGA